ncbi:MAG TPA: response regulator, partial [Bryobacteraceae bacterium]
RGSQFQFTAAFEVPTEQSMESPDPRVPLLRDRSALIVASNATSRTLLEDLLDGWSVRTATAANPVGRPETPGKQCDYLILDVDPAVLKRWTDEGTRDLFAARRVVVLVNPGDGSLPELLKTGAVRQLVKPVNPSELLSCLADLESADLAKTEAPRQEASPKGLESVRILLVEDNPVNQKVAQLMLSRLGHQVVAASDGQKALDVIAETEFDLVLMDVQMPVMDGYRAARRIRDLERQGKLPGRIPIVAMTAHAMAGDRERCLEAGMDDYIPKPIDSNLLRKTIDKYRLAARPV